VTAGQLFRYRKSSPADASTRSWEGGGVHYKEGVGLQERAGKVNRTGTGGSSYISVALDKNRTVCGQTAKARGLKLNQGVKALSRCHVEKKVEKAQSRISEKKEPASSGAKSLSQSIIKIKKLPAPPWSGGEQASCLARLAGRNERGEIGAHSVSRKSWRGMEKGATHR